LSSKEVKRSRKKEKKNQFSDRLEIGGLKIKKKKSEKRKTRGEANGGTKDPHTA